MSAIRRAINSVGGAPSSAASIAFSQTVYKAHQKFADANPEWMKLANDVVNRWGRHEVTLQQAIAEALMAVAAGEKPTTTPAAPTPPTRLIRRSTR